MTRGSSTKMAAVSGLISELVQAFKALAMYPPDHPARSRFLGRLDIDLVSYLEAEGELRIDVSAGGLEVDGEKVATGDNAHTFLASECFSRQINRVIFLRGLKQQDIDAFFSILSENPDTIREGGGSAEYIRSRSTGALKVEEVDYEGILERREEVSEGTGSAYSSETLSSVAAPREKPEPGRISTEAVFDDDGSPAVFQEDWLAQKLRDLDAARDPTQYKKVLRDIFMSLKATGEMGLSEHSLAVVRRLGRHLLREAPEEILTTARAAVRELAKPDLLESLMGEITSRETEDRDALQAVLEISGETAIPILLRSLSEEEGSFGRKALITSLGGFGSAVRPYLEKWLSDVRWYVVRNSLGLLGQVGGREDSQRVKGFLTHSNPNVRLEALRFLNRFPVPLSEETMQSLLGDTDPDVAARAVLSLGVLQGRKGLDRLRALARKPLFGQGDIEKRGLAIRGIGREDSFEAMDFLRGVITGRALLDSAGFERIQVAAVEALAEIGGPGAAGILRDSAGRLRGEASKAAEDALRKMKTREA